MKSFLLMRKEQTNLFSHPSSINSLAHISQTVKTEETYGLPAVMKLRFAPNQVFSTIYWQVNVRIAVGTVFQTQAPVLMKTFNVSCSSLKLPIARQLVCSTILKSHAFVEISQFADRRSVLAAQADAQLNSDDVDMLWKVWLDNFATTILKKSVVCNKPSAVNSIGSRGAPAKYVQIIFINFVQCVVMVYIICHCVRYLVPYYIFLFIWALSEQK